MTAGSCVEIGKRASAVRRGVISAWRDFADNRDASIIPAFSVALVPILTFLGMAVDYSRGNAFKTAMQAALDSTVLALSNSASGLTPEQITLNATSYFTTVLNRSDAQNVQVNVSYSNSNGSQIVMTASAAINTMFLGVAGG